MTTRLTQAARWPVDKLGRWTIVTNGSTPRRDDERYWADGKFPWLNSAVVNRESVITADQFVTATAMHECHLPVVEPGSLVVALTGQGKTRGMATIVQIRCTINQHLACIAPNPSRWIPRYLLWSLRSAYQALRATSDETGATKGGLTIEALQRHVLPMPLLNEQQRIADFLDRETAQIDALIAKQEQLIAGLRERLDATWAVHFSDASAQGLMVQVRRVVSSVVDGPFGSSLTSAHYTDSGTRVIRLGNIGVNEFKASDEAYISDEYASTLSEHSALPGDVVIAGLGDENQPLGRAAFVPDIGPAIVKADCFRARPTNLISGEYLAWALSAPPSRIQIRMLARGSTRQRINTSVAKSIEIPLPSRDQQDAIIAISREQTAKVADMIAKAEEFIALARERRAALITEAVTGRIDVSTGKAREGA